MMEQMDSLKLNEFDWYDMLPTRIWKGAWLGSGFGSFSNHHRTEAKMYEGGPNFPKGTADDR
jgi:hypothetical protein